MAVTENGYNDDIVARKWLRYFHLQTRHTVGEYRLLLLDGHGSHCTYEFIEYCDRHKIIPYCLPPHSTYLLQPLDIVVFQPYKHWHAQAVDEATRTGCTDFNKVEFLAALHDIRLHTFKANTIKTAWRKAGLVPHDPNVVLAQLPPPEPAPIARPITPISSPTVEKFVRAALVIASQGAIAANELERTNAATRARQDRHKDARRITQHGGVLLASTAGRIAKG